MILLPSIFLRQCYGVKEIRSLYPFPIVINISSVFLTLRRKTDLLFHYIHVCAVLTDFLH
jgi:hypothetical protein